MKSLIALIAAGSILLLLTGGCAKDSGNIATAYVSPLEYHRYNCNQLGQELTRVGRRMQEVAGVQNEEANEDAVVMGVGLVLFWPALFFLEGDTGREAELGRLKGEVDAVEQAAIEKDCRTVLARIDQAREEAKEEKKKRVCHAGACEEE